MAAEFQASVAPEKTQESALQGLLDYCTEHSVYIAPSIAAQTFPGRGLGIYTVKVIKKGEKLIHVPTKSLLTTQSIPDSFLAKQTVKKKFTVHCALAAYLAFGGEEVRKRYGPWMDTWPKVEEFLEGMPMFWWEDFRVDGGDEANLGSEKRPKKRRKTISEDDLSFDASVVEKTEVSITKTTTAPRFSLSPAIEGQWITIPAPGSTARSTDPSLPSPTKSALLPVQAQKLRSCIATISKYYPDLNITSPTSQHHYIRFLHAWSIVNTRCFYYLHPGQTPPEDSNEAMALCPFQDLFNHSATKGCVGIFDKRGFSVTADKDYAPGVELFINYGRHSNDALWIEYGFFMNGNKDDTLGIEAVVLASGEGGFSEEDKKALVRAGYFGGYTLRKDGVCYRTVTASYLGIVDMQQWKRMANGGFDPETNTAHAMLRLRAKQRIVDWILKARGEAEQNLRVLVVTIGVEDESLLVATFVTEALLTDKQRGSTQKKVQLARNRHAACVRRWKQIFDLCMSALRATERECRGAFLASDAGRKQCELDLTAQEFVDGLKRKEAGR